MKRIYQGGRASLSPLAAATRALDLIRHQESRAPLSRRLRPAFDSLLWYDAGLAEEGICGGPRTLGEFDADEGVKLEHAASRAYFS